MTTFTFRFLLPILTRLTVIISLFLFTCFSGDAQRNYSIIYSKNIKGNSTIFGNTLLNIVDSGKVSYVKMNDNSVNGNSLYRNDSANMQYADIDGNAGNGSVTRNSSSSDLILPDGNNTIKFARLYWGGFVVKKEFDLRTTTNETIKIRKGTTSAYSTITALAIDTSSVGSIETQQYQAYADVTEFIKNNGAGTYEVGNAPLSVGAYADGGGANGGWCIVVVYENENLNYNSIRLYDGFKAIYYGGSPIVSTVTLTGLNVPSGNLASADAKMGVVAWEGDASYNKDFLKINGNLFSNATNPPDNPWNGTITNNGVHVTTKNPDYTNQMGIDIDQFDAGTGYGISPNDSSVTLQFGTTTDRYFLGVFTFDIRMKDPVITLDESVADANNNGLGEKNELLTYTLKGKNTGTGNANSIIITDTLPSYVTYVANSLKVISSSGVSTGIKTDAWDNDNAEYIDNGQAKVVKFYLGAGSTGSLGGTLAPNEFYEVEFKVTINDPGAGRFVPPVINIARIKALSDANVTFVDDGMTIINPDNGLLPMTLISFTGIQLSVNKVRLEWNTSMEINCSQFTVERSQDGKIFYKVSTVLGNGTTMLKHFYSVTDDISDATSPTMYYRLKQTDIDKKETYSNIISVKLKNPDRQINISPNPFTSYLNVNINWNTNEMITAKVINVEGKEVIIKGIQMNKGFNYIQFDDVSKLPPGNYYIEFISSTDRATKKITKQ